MHARLLLPPAFLALVTVAVVPVTRRWAVPAAALVALTGVLATVTALTQRVDYLDGVGAAGIADERGFYVRSAGIPHPVTLADHTGSGLVTYGEAVGRLRAAGAEEVVTQGTITSVDQPPTVLGPSRGPLLFLVGNAGFMGVAAGRETLTLDGFGLTDSVGAHLDPPPPTRPGHEKLVPVVWFWARYGGTPGPHTPPEVTPDRVAAARAALSCGDAAELLSATEDPMSWGRFWSNVVHAPSLSSFRIPPDPYRARDELC